MDSTSLSLLQQARINAPEAWERIVRLYGPLVTFWCRQWGAQEADVEDIGQEVFRAVAVALPAFRRDRPGDTFRGWLRVIARHKFVDSCRRKQNQHLAQGGSSAYWHLLRLPDQPPPDDEPAEQVALLHRRALELLQSKFAENTWQAFWRCAIEGQSPKDVAVELNMSAVAVRQAKSRVLRRLRDEMGELLE